MPATAGESARSIEVHKSLDPTVDVGNLLIEDHDPLDIDEFNREGDAYLNTVIRDNAQYLINRIWELPTNRIDDAVVVQLPDPTTLLPREKIIPKAKPETKWERYAKLKGIRKTRKDQLVWDETTGTYKPRYGYKRTNDDTKNWVIEVPDHADPNHDYFAERKQKKKERTAKNELQRLRNIARAKTSTDELDGIGMTVEQKSIKATAGQAKRAKEATASLGKFTDTLRQEKTLKTQGQKRKFKPNVAGLSDEKKNAREIFDRLRSKRPKLDVEKAITETKREKRRTEQSEESAEPQAKQTKKGSGRKKSSSKAKKQLNRKRHQKRNKKVRG